MLKYTPVSNQPDADVHVFLEKTPVGTIKKEKGGWRYWAKAHSGVSGMLFPTLSEVKRSLED